MLSAIPICLLTSLKILKQVCDDLDKAKRRFLWARDGDISGGKCKVGHRQIPKPVNFGGLGILDLEDLVELLDCWLWFSWLNLIRPWVGTELPVDAQVTDRNGHKASFWRSSWIHGQAPLVLFPLWYNHSRRKNRTVSEAI